MPYNRILPYHHNTTNAYYCKSNAARAVSYYNPAPRYYNPPVLINNNLRLATELCPGLMSNSDFSKLENIAENANNYSLPIATAASVGGIKVGSGLSIDITTGVLSIDSAASGLDGTVNLTGAQTIAGKKTFEHDVIVEGSLTVQGEFASVTTTNTLVKDALIELGNGTTGAVNDSGIIIERGTEHNAFMGWDESADKFVMGTTTATGSDTGNLVITKGVLMADLQGNADTASEAKPHSALAQALDGIIDWSEDQEGKVIHTSNYTQYALPAASETVLGGIKAGDNLSATADGTLSCPNAIDWSEEQEGKVIHTSNYTQYTPPSAEELAGALSPYLAIKSIETDGGALAKTDSGKVLIPSGEARTYILPDVGDSAGVHFTFIAGSEDSHVVKCYDVQNVLEGQIIYEGLAGVTNTVGWQSISSEGKITLSNSAIGDRMEFISDGTKWYVTGKTGNQVDATPLGDQ